MEDSITRFAAKHRLTAAAALVQIIRDEEASAPARASAAQAILSYSDGKPGVTKHVTPADVAAMSDDERQEFLHLLLIFYDTEMPGRFKAIMAEAYTEILAQQTAVPRPNRFQRKAPIRIQAWRSPPIPSPDPDDPEPDPVREPEEPRKEPVPEAAEGMNGGAPHIAPRPSLIPVYGVCSPSSVESDFTPAHGVHPSVLRRSIHPPGWRPDENNYPWRPTK